METMPAPDLVLLRLRHLACIALNLHLTAAELAGLTRSDELAGLDSLVILEFVSAAGFFAAAPIGVV